MPNSPIGFYYANGQQQPSWALGDIRYGNVHGTNIDNIIGQREGSLGPYVKTHRIFKCPTDRSTTNPAESRSLPRVRSYSMNAFMGTLVRAGSGTWATFMKRSDLNVGPRAELFVFMDVHEDFLTSCLFDLSNDVALYHERWHNLPASRHNRSGAFSVTDGHVESHRWKDANTLQPVLGNYGGAFKIGQLFTARGGQDFHFVWQRATKNKLEP